jgi:hypothetical protein
MTCQFLRLTHKRPAVTRPGGSRRSHVHHATARLGPRGGGDACPTERAGGVPPQPGVDARGVEPVPALRQRARLVAVPELRNAHRALPRCR